jgi:hypothetical protein
MVSPGARPSATMMGRGASAFAKSGPSAIEDQVYAKSVLEGHYEFDSKVRTRSTVRCVNQLIRQGSTPIIGNCSIEAGVFFCLNLVIDVFEVLGGREDTTDGT